MSIFKDINYLQLFRHNTISINTLFDLLSWQSNTENKMSRKYKGLMSNSQITLNMQRIFDDYTTWLQDLLHRYSNQVCAMNTR